MLSKFKLSALCHPSSHPTHQDEFMGGLEPVSSVTSSETSEIAETKEKEQQIPIDDANFVPDQVLYILPNNLFSKEIKIIDITASAMDGVQPYTGGEIGDPFRNRAKALAKTHESSPLYTVERPHWYSRDSTIYQTGTPPPLPPPPMQEKPNSGSDDNNSSNGNDKGKEEEKRKEEKNNGSSSSSSSDARLELCHWRQAAISCGKAEQRFPAGSAHSAHALDLTHPHWYRRTSVWVHDSVQYDWTCDRQLRSNRMTLHRLVGGRREVGGRYAQRWGSCVRGGVLLIDTRVVDEVIATQTAVVMLRRMQQRVMESAKYSGKA
jgi:hypothetical protein